MYQHACFTAKQKTCLLYIHMQKYLLWHTAFHILWTKKKKNNITTTICPRLDLPEPANRER